MNFYCDHFLIFVLSPMLILSDVYISKWSRNGISQYFWRD